MKIEMGESLIYSWLRHVKECQITQNNWKVSNNWTLYNEDKLEKMFNTINNGFNSKFGINLFKQSVSVSQVIKQGECDALGVSIENNNIKYYACDIAFHENNLNYGSKMETVYKVIAKCVRSAFCLYGFLNTQEAEIIFATPLVSDSNKSDTTKKLIAKYISEVEKYFHSEGINYRFKFICNEDFNTEILEPVLIACKGTADTAELFARAFKLIDLFTNKKAGVSNKKAPNGVSVINPSPSAYQTLKVGTLVRSTFVDILKSGKITKQELNDLLDKDASNKLFGIKYPTLSKTKDPKERYYADPITIFNDEYYICNDWYEKNKSLLIDWILKH